MLQKRYQALLIKHLTQQISKEIQAENPDKDLLIVTDFGVKVETPPFS